MDPRTAVDQAGSATVDAIPRHGAGIRAAHTALLAVAILALAALFPQLHGAARGAVVPVTLEARQATINIAQGVRMRAWTFNGTVPGPVIRATEGDTIQVTLINADRGTPARKVRVKRKVRKGKKPRWRVKRIRAVPGMRHSIDFHAAEIAPDQAFRSIPPGETHTFSFVARRAGVYVYHCGTAPMLQHMGMGMYGAIVIDPVTPRAPVAKEVTLVQSEFYGPVKNRKIHPTHRAMANQAPKYLAFNGQAGKYVRNPIKVPVGEPVRINLVDAGPNLFSAFHVVGSVFDRYEPDGNPDRFLTGVSTQTIAPGGAGVFELRFAEPGRYPFVSHAMRDMERGAMGIFEAS